MTSMRRTSIRLCACLALMLTTPVSWTSAAPGGQAANTEHAGMAAALKSADRGTLRVTVIGTGTYRVIGRKFRRSGTTSKKFRLTPGIYRVRALDGSVKPPRVVVRKGKVSRVKVRFGGATPPVTPPVPDPGVSPTPNPTLPPPPPPEPPRPPKGSIIRVSTSATGEQTNDISELPSWSPDGTRLAFTSHASNLVPGDTNDAKDVFVKDLATGAVQRISTDPTGAQGNHDSYTPVWSPDGRSIAFGSFASNFVAGDTNALGDIFVKNLVNGAIQRISTDSLGREGNQPSGEQTWSPDGSKIAFTSQASNFAAGDVNGQSDVFVKNLSDGALRHVSTDAAGVPANGYSAGPAWAPDGQRIGFRSYGNNLVPGDTNISVDLYVKTLLGGAVARVSTDSSNGQVNGESSGLAWSPSGTQIAFISKASDLVPGDTNKKDDVFIKDLTSGAVTRLSTDASGTESNDWAGAPGWSPDGKRIAFNSAASNLVPGDSNGFGDIFVKALADGSIERISTNASGGQSDGYSLSVFNWSPDGTRIAFTSEATNLVPGDTNGIQDVFIKTVA